MRDLGVSPKWTIFGDALTLLAAANFGERRHREVRILGLLGSSPFGDSQKFAKKVIINTAIE
jgi:hypothetical protein